MKSYRIITCLLYLFLLHLNVNAQTTDEASFSQIFDIIYSHNFDNDTEGDYRETEWKRDWNNPTWANHALGYGIILKDNVSKNLQISFPKGEMGMDSSGVQWHGKFSQGYDELYLTYKVKFSQGFTNKDLQGKLPGFSGAASNTGGSLPTGKDGWSTRYMFHGTEILFYLYYPEMYKDFGDDTPVAGKTYYGSAVYFQPGFTLQPNVWYTVTQRVVMNTIGKADGLVEGYLNGKLCAVKTGMRFRDISSIQIDRINFGNFLGGSGKPPLNDEFIYYDDFCVFSYKPWVNVPRGTTKSPSGRVLFMPDINQIKSWGDKISASNTTSNASDIQWTEYPLSVTGYVLERKAANETIYKNVAILAFGQTSYRDQNLEPGKNYIYRIKAYNNSDFTDYSKEISIVTVAAAPVNNAPVIKDQVFTVSQGNFSNNIVGKIAATDPDAGQLLSFSIISGNTSNIFSLNSTTGELSTLTTNLFKPGDTVVYTLNIKVTDNSALPKSSTAVVTIKLIGNPLVIANQNPIIKNQAFTVKQSSFSSGLIGKIVASDPDVGQQLSFKINTGNNAALFILNNNTGDLSSNSTSLFKAGDTISYLLNITVTDNGSSPKSSSADITVKCIGNPVVVAINNSPVILPQTFSILQSSFKSNLVGKIIASDPDAGQVLTYSIVSENTAGLFLVNSSTGDLTTTTSNVFRNADTLEHTLSIKVTDNGNTPRNSLATIVIRFIGNSPVLPANNSPVIDNQAFTVYEQAFENNFIGRIVAADSDPSQKLSYSIVSGNFANLFQIDRETGVLSTTSDNIFKTDTMVINLVVAVTDNAIAAKSANATIEVKLIGKQKNDLKSPLTMHVYPNPSNGKINVKIDEQVGGEITTENSNTRIEIRGLNGESIVSKIIENQEYNTLEYFDLSDLRNGTYVVSAKKGNMILSKTIILNK